LGIKPELVNEGNTDYNDKHYKLTANINLSAYGASWNDGKGWIPIGTWLDVNNNSPFKGNFDGNKHKVSGLYINDNSIGFVGLFGYISGGAVQNLGVEGEVTGRDAVGGLAGYISDSSITNCYAIGAVSGANVVGGLVGYISGGSITNIYATGTVSGNDRVGGLVGSIVNISSITNSYTTGAVSGNNHVGGIVGFVWTNCNLKNSAALNLSVMRISGSNEGFGRVAGWNNSDVLNNNIAWAGMSVIEDGNTVTSDDGESLHGTDITSAAVRADGTIGGRFTTADGWTIQNGRLPGLFGETVAMPEHLE
jgi:hypothetical protein